MEILHNNGYFAAVNSKRGFVSFFDTVFSEKELDFVYIIKGGSGTGKSRFMKELVSAAESRGESAELFYCSSDPRSLDGIILKERKIAVIDGTAPHVAEPKNAGCFDEILNFAEFWDSKILITCKAEITELQKRKKELYYRAYSCLSSAGELADLKDMLTLPAIKLDKLNSFAERFASRFPQSKRFEEKLRITKGISYMGVTDTGAFEDRAKRGIYISDRFGVSATVFAAIRRALAKRKASFEYSVDPLIPEKTDGIFLIDDKISIMSVKNPPVGADVINCERFIDRALISNQRRFLKFLDNGSLRLVAQASDIMKEIFALHSEVEKIYCLAMDFTKKEEFTRRFTEKIFR